MKKASEIKYPNSANLFLFCRRVLDHKLGGMRVIDQDVGQILGFDPADCSHWKKGKKNIRSIQAMKSIAESLGVDEKLVIDVAAGELNVHEGFFEYAGYGQFDIESRVVETAKKEFYRRHAASWTKEKEQTFKEFFKINENLIDAEVKHLHERINLQEAPLYLPEICALFPQLKLLSKPAVQSEDEQAGTSGVELDMSNPAAPVISVPEGSETRPFARFQIGRCLAQVVLGSKLSLETNELKEYSAQLSAIHYNVFAAKLLTPAVLIRQEMARVNMSRDIVAQLADIFWVSKTFMNRRLKDVLQHNPAI